MREADDGQAAIELLREEMDIALRSPGRGFDVIFMDSVMVWKEHCFLKILKIYISITIFVFQLQMHGPEAVKIMRNSLRYSGTIIGIVYLPLSSAYIIVLNCIM